MSDTKDTFLNKSTSFAMEMARAALLLPEAKSHFGLGGRWIQAEISSDWENQDQEDPGQHLTAFITMVIIISPGVTVYADCFVYLTNHEWTTGDGQIWLVGENGLPRQDARFEFVCQLDAEGQIKAEVID